MWSSVLERGQLSFPKISKQISMTWRKYCEAHKFFAEYFWRKMPEPATRKVDTVSDITVSISRMLTQDKSKTFHKNYYFQADNIF